mgnify:CR=1 FL=1
MRNLSYWVGVNTTSAAAAVQLHVDTTDHLGFALQQFSAILPLDVGGSIQGVFAYYSGSGATQDVYIDYLGAPGASFDWAVQD